MKLISSVHLVVRLRKRGAASVLLHWPSIKHREDSLMLFIRVVDKDRIVIKFVSFIKEEGKC